MTEIGWTGLLASLALVVVAVLMSRWQRLGVEAAMTGATVRAIVQLVAVGLVIGFLIGPEASLWWSWAWVMVMVGFAAITVRRRAPEVRGLIWPAILAFAAAGAATLGVVFGLGIFPLEARVLVPVAGMMIGNSMSSTVVTARRVVEELSDKRLEVEARLSLGQPFRQAARPYLRSALRTALIPQIESTKAVGVVFLPGTMTGLILAGADPLDAVLIQAAVMFLVLGSVAITCTVMGWGVVERLFTPDHRLRRLPRPAS